MKPRKLVKHARRSVLAFLFLFLPILVFSFSQITPVFAGSSASIVMNKPSYQPGETVTVSGSSWKLTSQNKVTVTFLRPSATGMKGDTITCSVDGNGAFQGGYTIPSNAERGVTWKVEAIDRNGETAYTSFTIQSTAVFSSKISTVGQIAVAPIQVYVDPNYYRLNFSMFVYEFYRGSAGYNKIMNGKGEVQVYNEQFKLEYLSGAQWKQRGVPKDVLLTKINDNYYNVTRTYDDSLGTKFNVTYSVKNDQNVKITITIKSGQTDNYRLVWEPSGIVNPKTGSTLTEIAKTNAVEFGSKDARNYICFDWNDVYRALGSVTQASYSNVAQGRKATIAFTVGTINAGQTKVIDPATVGLSSTTLAVRRVYQKRTYYDGNFWAFYCNNTHYVYRTSADGSAWSATTAVKAATDGEVISLAFNGAHVYYLWATYTVNNPVVSNHGTISGTTITWDGEVTVEAATAGERKLAPTIAVNSAGIAWAQWVVWIDAANGTVRAAKAADAGATSWGAASTLNAASIGNSHRGQIVALTSTRMYCVYWGNAEVMRGKLYNGAAWGGEEIVTTTKNVDASYFDTCADGDDVYVAFANTVPNLICVKRTYGVGWGAETTVQAAVTATTAPAISAKIGSNLLYMFWAGSPAADHIYYKKCVAGSWDAAPTDWIDESINDLTNYAYLTCFYTILQSRIGLLYLRGVGAPPYTVRFAFLPPPVNGAGSISDRDDTNNLYAMKRYYTGVSSATDEAGYLHIHLMTYSLKSGSDYRATFQFHEDDNTFSTTAGGASWTLATGKEITAFNFAQLDTGQSKFGGASAQFTVGNDYLRLDDSADWVFSTIDCWVRFNALPAVGNEATFFSQYADANNWQCFAVRADAGPLYVVRYSVCSAGVTIIDVVKSSNPGLVVNTWYHLAVVRNGNTFTLYQDGTSLGSETDADAVPDLAGNVYIGQKGDGTGYFNGWLDELRVSKGVARWTANFAAPAAAYSPDSKTVFLSHFDGADATTNFLDNAGSNFLKSGNTVTVNWVFMAKWDATEESNLSIELYVIDAGYLDDTDTAQSNYLDVVTRLVTSGFASNKAVTDLGGSITVSGTAYYGNNPASNVASTSYPPDWEFTGVSIHSAAHAVQATDNVIVNGAFSVSFNIPVAIQNNVYHVYFDMVDASYTDADAVDGDTASCWGSRIEHYQFGTTDADRLVGRNTAARIWVKSRYEHDLAPFAGGGGSSLSINGTAATWNGGTQYWFVDFTVNAVSNRTFVVSTFVDAVYGLTANRTTAPALWVQWTDISVGSIAVSGTSGTYQTQLNITVTWAHNASAVNNGKFFVYNATHQITNANSSATGLVQFTLVGTLHGASTVSLNGTRWYGGEYINTFSGTSLGYSVTASGLTATMPGSTKNGDTASIPYSFTNAAVLNAVSLKLENVRVCFRILSGPTVILTSNTTGLFDVNAGALYSSTHSFTVTGISSTGWYTCRIAVYHLGSEWQLATQDYPIYLMAGGSSDGGGGGGGVTKPPFLLSVADLSNSALAGQQLTGLIHVTFTGAPSLQIARAETNVTWLTFPSLPNGTLTSPIDLSWLANIPYDLPTGQYVIRVTVTGKDNALEGTSFGYITLDVTSTAPVQDWTSNLGLIIVLIAVAVILLSSSGKGRQKRAPRLTHVRRKRGR